MTATVELAPHRDAMRYLQVQALVFGFTAFLCFAVVTINLLFKASALDHRDWIWMSAGVVLGVAAIMGFRWSRRQHPQMLRLANDTLSVGDTEVPLNATTKIELVTPARLDQPKPNKLAIFRFRAFGGFPHFDGGPWVRVRTGSATIEFQPLLYGPAAFFGAAADPDAATLIDALTTTSSRGDIAPWLRSIFLPRDIPNVVTSVKVFVASYLVVSLVITTFLGYLFIFGLHRSLAG